MPSVYKLQGRPDKRRRTYIRICGEKNADGCGKKFAPRGKHTFYCDECRKKRIKAAAAIRRKNKKCGKPLYLL